MGKRVSAVAGNILKLRRNLGHNLLIPVIILLLSGCAAVDQSVNFLYQPTAFGRGGSGDLYLSAGDQSSSGKASSVQWVIGEIKTRDGENSGNITSVRSPMDMVMDAFAQEFKAAGYNVLEINTLPAGVSKGIRLNGVVIELGEVNSLYKIEAKCTVKVAIELWRNGKTIKELNYENNYTDSTLIDRDLFLLKSLQTTLQELMARVVREVTVIIEQK
jgi:hypothetical protein